VKHLKTFNEKFSLTNQHYGEATIKDIMEAIFGIEVDSVSDVISLLDSNAAEYKGQPLTQLNVKDNSEVETLIDGFLNQPCELLMDFDTNQLTIILAPFGFDITFNVDASQLQAALEQLSHKYKIKPLNESHEGLIDREVIITKDGVTKGAHAFILNWYGSGSEIMNKEESTDTNIHKIKVRFGLSKTDPVGWYKRHEFIFAGEDSKENLSDMQAKYDEKKRHFDKVRDEFNNFKFELKKKGYSITKDKISI
jgi:hypothetical protein